MDSTHNSPARKKMRPQVGDKNLEDTLFEPSANFSQGSNLYNVTNDNDSLAFFCGGEKENSLHFGGPEMETSKDDIPKDKTLEVEDNPRNRTLEFEGNLKNQTLEVDSLRCFNLADFVKDACNDLSIMTSFQNEVTSRVEMLDYSITEYVCGRSNVVEEVKGSINNFVTFITDFVSGETTKRLKDMHEKEIHDYQYMYEMEKNKRNDAEKEFRILEDQREETLKAFEAEKQESAGIMERERQEMARIVEEYKNKIAELEAKAAAPAPPVQAPAENRQLTALKSELSRSRSKMSKLGELEQSNQDLIYEVGLLKLNSNLITESEAKESFGDDVSQRLVAYLQNHSQV